MRLPAPKADRKFNPGPMVGQAIAAVLLAGSVIVALWLAGNLSWPAVLFTVLGSAAAIWFLHRDFNKAAKRHDKQWTASPRLTGGPRSPKEVYLYVWRAASVISTAAWFGALIALLTGRGILLLALAGIGVGFGIAKIVMPKIAERFLGIDYDWISGYEAE